jgi:asparagine synthase (glutamine-hydrolysing)
MTIPSFVARVDLVADGWATSGATRARGYAHLDGRFLRAEALAAALDGCATPADWQAIVRRLNGCFALVTRRDGGLLAAVDRIRSIPLFYSTRGRELVLSDSAYAVLEGSGSDAIDAAADAEFRLTGYVTGRETLYAGVYQIEAGELLRWDEGNAAALERHRYYAFRHGDFLSSGTSALISALDQVHAGVFKRLVESVGERTIVVPLSGGYDSRLIGVSLRDLGVRDAVCYSYGVPDNWESRISQELARYLGFRWEFVPYSAERWRAWGASERFAEFFRAAGNLSSVPHIQDWPAVLELQRERRIPPGSVFVPGHSGDFLAGSHVPKWYVERPSLRRRDVLDSILRAHYSLWDWPPDGERALRHRFDQRIESVAGPVRDCSPEEAADTFERWDLQERQAKFICNSARVYESFGFEWRLPLFDAELMDFWARIPVELRTGRRLYLEFARQRQALPVTDANRDHGPLVNFLIKGTEEAGLRPMAKRVQRLVRRLRWQREYMGSPLAWFAIVDRDTFRCTYTGKELMHSYLALRYRDLVGRDLAGGVTQ